MFDSVNPVFIYISLSSLNVAINCILPRCLFSLRTIFTFKNFSIQLFEKV